MHNIKIWHNRFFCELNRVHILDHPLVNHGLCFPGQHLQTREHTIFVVLRLIKRGYIDTRELRRLEQESLAPALPASFLPPDEELCQL